RLIIRFVEEVDAAAFEKNELVQSAVLHQLLVLGEATKRLSEDFRMAHPHIPWALIAQNRDRLIHGYDTVDLGIVWNTVTSDVPELLKQIEPLLPPLAQ